ncbi:MAG: hypothetical protein ACO3RV_00615, partial [Luteolibacter sp.]
MKPKLINSPFRKQAFGAFLVTTIAVCLSEVSQAQTDNLWTGSVSSSWDTDENWNQGVVPTKLGNFHATINTDSPFIATISESIQAPVDIIIGTGVGSNGRVDHTGGEASTGDGNWMFVGRNGGMGIYNLADTAGSGGSFTGYGIGSGKMIVNGALYIGGTDGAAGSNGIVNINTNSDVSLAVNGRFQVGTNSSQGTLNLDNGSITTTEWTEFGNGVGCTGTLNMSGGSIAKNGNDHMGIGANGGTGVANITGGTISINNELWVGQGGGSNGTINLSNGTINIGSWVNIGRAGGTGTLNLSGGVINAGPNGDAFTVGDQDNSTGNLVQTGGELNISNQFWVGSGGGTNNGQYTMSGGNLNVNEWIAIGRGGLGEFNMSGGTFTKTGDGTALIVGSAGTGTFNQTGGLVNVVAGETWMGENGSGYYTLDGASAEFRTQYFQVARNESSNFTVNLNDGILLVNQIAGGTGNATVNFNGAQVVARSSQTAFIDGLDTAEIGTG